MHRALAAPVGYFGFRVWGLGFRVGRLGFRVLRFRVLRFRVLRFRFGISCSFGAVCFVSRCRRDLQDLGFVDHRRSGSSILECKVRIHTKTEVFTYMYIHALYTI